jgi:hypothetical protein
MNFFRLSLACVAVAAMLPIGLAQSHATAPHPVLSPPAQASVTLNGKPVTIHYSAPSMRGRKIFGGLVPYGKVWRTGANAATSLTTPVDLMIGGTKIPAGSYTLFTLPNPNRWTLIVNSKTGEWGLAYDKSHDFARIPMELTTLSTPQEKMSISFEKTQGARTELHIRWDTTDAWVPVQAK